ncbi:MAG TPA: aldehyde dehydrogenase family protein, partial [Microthrixaceae bacterium]|nr:aldehyde dehydrogenase family protein [Microthrixaceae bacterium]
MSFHEPKLLIDGQLVDATGAATYDNTNPATGKVIGQAPDASLADIDRAIAAARRAFDETDWSTNTELRVRCLRQLHDAYLANSEEIRAMTVAEVGCPVGLTYAAQLDIPVSSIAYNADLLEGYEFDTDLGEAVPLGIKTHRTIAREA